MQYLSNNNNYDNKIHANCLATFIATGFHFFDFSKLIKCFVFFLFVYGFLCEIFIQFIHIC